MGLLHTNKWLVALFIVLGELHVISADGTHQRSLQGWFGGGSTASVSVSGDFALRRAPEVCVVGWLV